MTTPWLADPDGAEDAGEGDGTELEEHEHDRHRQADVADPVGDERLLGRRRGGGLVLPEADQQVGREAHALPAGV